MTDSNPNPVLPKDVAAYLAQASAEIAREQGFAPAGEADVSGWMLENMPAIVDRARKLQERLLLKIHTGNTMTILEKVIGSRVWAQVQHGKITQKANRVINAALLA
ncbi:hypothetical protein SAMN05216576_107199 [Ectopseudomonas chengduensis]|jgi:hypothetical protein|uniref:Uncharacterized protein n=1 Tax=Ectopseudomonas chengduensis TaxID=489632 RepID=A0A1G6Q0U0_9GAMM|nr:MULTISPECIES: hypothetical protein [Pseudomonas]MBP3062025.1 hypothetical protein [Pseudomonas chengduensis]NNB75318.1 hypothetical protein [Pseudomonas chengduensis]OEO24436.1 hypothetical protein AX279_17355 [Pseudomonas sp. J237]SDC86060.1 hypothetical protein SAMN05216576_107199 [Pseudomonas chengduensis]